MSSSKLRWYKDIDLFLIIVVLALCAFGVLALSSATRSFESGSVTYVVKQLIFGGIGFLAMLWLIRTDYRGLVRYVEFGYWACIVLLIVVFFMPAVNGAHGWIPLGGFSLQPSEFFKIIFILLTAKLLANEQEDEEGRRPDPLRNLLFLIGYGVLGAGLILVEPDLGQTMILLAIAATAMFVHMRGRVFWIVFLIVMVLVLAFFAVRIAYPDQLLSVMKALMDYGILEQHQYDRFEIFVCPECNLAEDGFQVFQAQVAIGSGQLFGKGLYHGSQTQGNWVPEQQTDFIFTVIGEELGFVGSVAVIFLFFLLIYRIIANGLAASDRTGMYICAMIAGMFTFQIFENIGMSLTLMPMTGVTLPFISYGGSSIITNFMLMGIVINIGVRRRKLSFVS